MNMRPAFYLSMAAVALVVACDSGSQNPSPTSPDLSTGASASGGAGSGSSATTANEIKGTVTGLTGTCPAVTFKLEGKTIRASAATAYGDRTCADVKNDVKVTVVGTAQADGSILATKVLIAPPPAPAQVEIKGTVTGLTGTCPAVTFALEGKTIRASAATAYGDRTCADVKNDVKVTVVGTAQADGSILATKVLIAPPPAPVPAIAGVITALAGTCPALTITVGAKTATTTPATVFDGKACADLKVGVEVGIFGAVPAGGSTVVATMVKSLK